MYGLVEFSVVPIGTGTTSVSKYVKKAIDIVKKSNFKYEISSMGTIIEGEIPKILDLILEINELLVDDTGRVITSIKIDYRKDKLSTIYNKKKAIE